MKYYIVTGTSKGLGAALINCLADSEVTLITCSRKGLSEHQQLALVEKGAKVIDFKVDLSRPEVIIQAASEMMAAVDLSIASQIVLINNAGGVEPIAPFHKADDQAVIDNINLNLVAPMILSRHFGQKFGHIGIDRRIITVSSGAGKRPIFGWNSYCASKAAVDMMTRVIGLEEGVDGIKALSFGPGIMDTDMQGVIRSSSEEDFKDIEQFKGFKANGDLLTPDQVAEVLARLVRDDFEQGGIVSVKDYL